MPQSGHVMVIAPMNFLQLSSPTQDVHQIKPVSIPAGPEEGSPASSSSCYWQEMASRRRGVMWCGCGCR